MKSILSDYKLVGVNTEMTCPDCFEIRARPVTSPVECFAQRTLFRMHEETDSEFWHRVLREGTTMVDPKCIRTIVVIYCKYNQPYIPNVEIHDNWSNAVRLLQHVADNDPLQKVRVKALCGLCDLLEAKEKRERAAGIPSL